MARVVHKPRNPAPMPARPVNDPFGEADLEGDEANRPASRCSSPPPNMTLELEIGSDLMAELRATEPNSTRDTQPEQTRPTTPGVHRESGPHSIEEALHRAVTVRPAAPTPATIAEAVLRLIESRPRLVPKA